MTTGRLHCGRGSWGAMPQLARKHKFNKIANQPSLLITSLVFSALLCLYAWPTISAGSQPRRGGSSIQHSKHKAAAAAFLPEVQASCPAWIAEYAAFHRQNRGKPGAKYLVYSACPGYSGLGDRVRGMMYLTRLAASTNRVVLFTWRNEPHEVEQYLPPAADIDWTPKGIEGYDFPDFSTFCGKNASNAEARSLLPGYEQYELLPAPGTGSLQKGVSRHTKGSKQQTGIIALRATDYKREDAPLKRYILKGGLKHLEQHQFVTIHTNEQFYSPCPGCPKVAHATPQPVLNKDGSRTVDVAAACLYRQLFGLSDAVQTLAQKQLESLYGRQARQPGFQYLAVHLRLGGMESEAKLITNKGSGKGPLTDVAHSITCIKNLGMRMGIDTSKVPVLLFTDHHELRKFVKQGGLANVITTDVVPTHLARMSEEEEADPESAISTYVDLALLARARCAVYSRSGFSTTAWMMGGGTDCYERISSGLERCLSKAAGSAGSFFRR